LFYNRYHTKKAEIAVQKSIDTRMKIYKLEKINKNGI